MYIPLSHLGTYYMDDCHLLLLNNFIIAFEYLEKQ